MSAASELTDRQAGHAEDPPTARGWVDALSANGCDQDGFVAGVGTLLSANPDAAWDVLALLDQYFRRGKLQALTFQAVKTRVARMALGSVPGANATLESRSAAPSGPVDEAKPGSERVPAVGELLRGRYRLTGTLGKNAIGGLFEGIDLDRVDGAGVGRRVAIKVLDAGVMSRPDSLAEIRRQFQILQSLSHPNILRVHEFDRDGNRGFFTMELLRGVRLAELLEARGERGLDRARIVSIIRELGAALAYAHSCGITHGRLGPGKIFITRSGAVRVLDFGAGRGMNGDSPPANPQSIHDDAAASLRYASCQVIEGHPPGARDDIYSFACLIYELLSGHEPFPGRTAVEARALGLSPAAAPLMPAHGLVLQQGLAFEYAQRPADVAAWLAQLDLDDARPDVPAAPSVSPAVDAPPTAAAPEPPAPIHAPVPGLIPTVDEAPPTQDEAQVPAPSPAAPRRLVRRAALGAAVILAICAAVWFAAARLQVGLQTALAPRVPGNSEAGAKPMASDAALDQSPPAPVQAAQEPAPAPQAQTEAPQQAQVEAPQPQAQPPQPQSPAVHAHIALADAVVNVDPGAGEAVVTVRRNGNLRGDASFNWWTEAGTAKPGTDFLGTASPRIQHIPAGQKSVDLVIPLVAESTRGRRRNFYVLIAATTPRAATITRHATSVWLPADR